MENTFQNKVCVGKRRIYNNLAKDCQKILVPIVPSSSAPAAKKLNNSKRRTIKAKMVNAVLLKDFIVLDNVSEAGFISAEC